MSDTTLGQLIDGDAQRDAIHVAIAPVAAGEALMPGDHVGLNVSGEADASIHPKIGVVDPFLTRRVAKGEKFWLCLYQKTVTGMRHHWSHPAFRDDGLPKGSEAEEWIRDWAKGLGLGYDEVIFHARDYVDRGEYWSEGGRFESWDVPEVFWTHFEKITGKKGEGHFFSCSC